MRTLFVISAMLLSAYVSGQDYDVVAKINKRVSVVSKNDLLGMTIKGELVVPPIYKDYIHEFSGVTFFGDSTASFIDYDGNVILSGAYTDIMEDDYVKLLIVMNTKNEYAAFDLTGKMIVPFGRYEIYPLTKSIICTGQGMSSMYDHQGNVIIPMGEHIIDPVDDEGEFVSVRPKGSYDAKMLLTDSYIYPEGYVPVNAEFFSKQTEVSVREYFLFVSVVKSLGEFQDERTGEIITYEQLLPDTNFVESKLLPLYRHLYRELSIVEGGKEQSKDEIRYGRYAFSVNLPYKLSKNEKDMAAFPVTGVSYDQAGWYAEWLTSTCNEWFSSDYGYMFQFLLPSEDEWITMAEDGLSDEMKQRHVQDSLNPEGCMLFIYTDLPNCTGYEGYLKASLGSGSVPAGMMNPDLNGLVNVFGNVSEMTSDPGIAKGGNYTLPASEALTTKQNTYSGPAPWLGFRLIGEYRF